MPGRKRSVPASNTSVAPASKHRCRGPAAYELEPPAIVCALLMRILLAAIFLTRPSRLLTCTTLHFPALWQPDVLPCRSGRRWRVLRALERSGTELSAGGELVSAGYNGQREN